MSKAQVAIHWHGDVNMKFLHPQGPTEKILLATAWWWLLDFDRGCIL